MSVSLNLRSDALIVRVVIAVALFLAVSAPARCQAQTNDASLQTESLDQSDGPSSDDSAEIYSLTDLNEATALTDSERGEQVVPAQAQLPTQTQTPAPRGAGASANTGGDISLRGSGGRGTPGNLSIASTRGSTGRNTVLGAEAQKRPSTDAGGLLIQSSSVLGVSAQKRNPVSADVRTRGDYVGQTLASGSFWIPARMDLDTMLNKIDSRIISQMTVIKGPYSALYGPAFDFVAFELLPSPRFEDGFESHGSSSFDFHGNGQRWYGRQSFWGGAEDWGVRVSYGHRTGNDYRTGAGGGAGFELPSSFNSRDWDVALGFDLTENSTLEFNLLRLDQTGVEYPGYVYDLDFLVTDSYQIRYALRDQALFDELGVEGWYNRTRFEGNANRPGKRLQIPELGSFAGRAAFSDADATSTGASGAFSWQNVLGGTLTLGADTRFVKQELNELIDSSIAPAPIALDLAGIIPRASSVNPGLFFQQEFRPSDALAVTAGGRVDLVQTNVEELGLLGNQLDDRNFTLWSIFATAQRSLGTNWAANAGVGYAQRPPTLTELYADATTISMLQQGLNKLFGNDDLNESSRLQVDVGLTTDQEVFRGGLNGFYSWTDDYITVQGAAADTFVFINTDRATIWGTEAFGEYDLRREVGVFGQFMVTEGTDETNTAVGGPSPLPNIPPFESRVGIRFRDEPIAPSWQVELSTRMVAAQDRPATVLLEQATSGFTVVDLRGFHQVAEDFLLIGGVENLTDRFYREHLDIRSGRGVFQPGVNLYFGSQLTY